MKLIEIPNLGNILLVEIYIAVHNHDIEATFPLMVQLHPNITAASYLPMIRELATHSGYQLATLRDRQQIRAIAGFRISYSLASGKYLYIDDLITDQASRSKGYGSALFDWLKAHAQQNGCNELDLDSGVQRHDAHRFYFKQRMAISSYHFRMKI